MSEGDQEKKIRVDKWLWAARFFKTRALAAQAVTGGHVHVNGERVKPARSVKAGDELRITRGNDEFVVSVTALHDRRGPATLARTLYEETEASIEARLKGREERRLMATAGGKGPLRKPGKRDRRLIRK
ncbi:MAG: RNA-binding S4 domain-containing protein, partial [Desulfobulbaceae bacterium]|nr:RNA-binding S4 domain-containing protein [Desulfobulbaceae bacterium]